MGRPAGALAAGWFCAGEGDGGLRVGIVGCGRQSGGVALLNHRLQAGTPAGVRICGVGLPVVSLVDSLTTGYEPSSLRDEEVGEGREPRHDEMWMMDGMGGKA